MTQEEHYIELQRRLAKIEKKAMEDRARMSATAIEAFKGKLVQTFEAADRAMFTTGEIVDMIRKA